MTNDDFWEKERERFHQREKERSIVRETLEPILSKLTSAETAFAGLGVIRAEERYRLGRARLELLRLLRSLEKSGDTLSENNMRASDAFIAES